MHVTTDQWSPLNPEGKKQYDRNFMLKLQYEPSSMTRPANLPVFLDIILDEVDRYCLVYVYVCVCMCLCARIVL